MITRSSRTNSPYKDSPRTTSSSRGRGRGGGRSTSTRTSTPRTNSGNKNNSSTSIINKKNNKKYTDTHINVNVNANTKAGAEANGTSTNKNKIDVGKMVEVYWSSDETYYSGKVVQKAAKRSRRRTISQPEHDHANAHASASNNNDDDNEFKYLIEYEDGEEGWVDLSNTKIRVMNNEDSKRLQEQNQKVKTKVEQLNLHSRLLIYWPQEKKYFPGILDVIDYTDQSLFENGCADSGGHKVQVDNSCKKKKKRMHHKPHHIRYDDGDEEWTNLLYRDFHIVEGGPLKIKEEKKKNEDQRGQKRKRQVMQKDHQQMHSVKIEKSKSYRTPVKRQKTEKQAKAKQATHTLVSSPLTSLNRAANATLTRNQKTEITYEMKAGANSNSKRDEDTMATSKACSEFTFTFPSGRKKSQCTSLVTPTSTLINTKPDVNVTYKHHQTIVTAPTETNKKKDPISMQSSNQTNQTSEDDAKEEGDSFCRINVLKDICIIS